MSTTISFGLWDFQGQRHGMKRAVWKFQAIKIMKYLAPTYHSGLVGGVKLADVEDGEVLTCCVPVHLNAFLSCWERSGTWVICM